MELDAAVLRRPRILAFVAVGPEEPEGRDPAQLIFELYGTHVLISSSQLSRERLLELVAGLVEA